MRSFLTLFFGFSLLLLAQLDSAFSSGGPQTKSKIVSSSNKDNSKLLNRGKKAAPIPGCTYSEADNYDSNATEDSGTCVFTNYDASLPVAP